jgi:hypothetical protein
MSAPFLHAISRPARLCFPRRIRYVPGLVPGPPRVAERVRRFCAIVTLALVVIGFPVAVPPLPDKH